MTKTELREAYQILTIISSLDCGKKYNGEEKLPVHEHISEHKNNGKKQCD